jgi:hypothetical protein
MKTSHKGFRRVLLLAAAFHLMSIFLTNIIGYQEFKIVKEHLPARSAQILDATVKTAEAIPQPIQTVLGYYTSLTGITGYSFFSPDPPYPYQILIERTNTEGGQNVNTLSFETQEGYNRLIAAANFIRDIKNDTIKDIVMRSIAARTYEKFPNTADLRLITAYYILPPPKSFSNGHKAQFEQHLLYEFKKL